MLLVRFLTGFPWITAVFVGAVVATPSPPVILPMLRNSGIPRNLKVTVILESALGEALGLVIALAILRLAVSDAMMAGHLIGGLLSSFIVAAVIGLVAGIGWALVLKQVRELKHPMILTPSLVFIVVGLTDYLEFSGPVSALALGFVLGNLGGIARKFKWAGDEVAPARVEKIEMEFIGELVFLLKTFFFVFLGISMRPADLWSPTAFTIIGLLLLVRFVVRAFLATGYYQLRRRWRDRGELDSQGPRGRGHGRRCRQRAGSSPRRRGRESHLRHHLLQHRDDRSARLSLRKNPSASRLLRMVVSSQLEQPSHQEKAACCLLPSVDGDRSF